MTTADFYDNYHQKNDNFTGVIGDNNFTYFYILQTLQEAYKMLGKNWPQVKVLDVGCGVGTLALYLGSKGAKVDGIDISPRAIAIASDAAKSSGLAKNVKFKKELLKFSKQGKYDLVICSEVIEHIPNDENFLRDLISQLKPNGVLLLTTPSSQNILTKIGFYNKFDAEVGHLRRYTHTSIQQLFHNQRADLLYLAEVEGPLRNILFTTELGFLIRFIRGPFIPLFHIFDILSAHLFGATDLQVVAAKK